MRVWRLAPSLHPPLSGEGARLVGGRWNSPGTPLVYTSAYLSLAVLEILVHFDVQRLPTNLIAYEIEFPDDAREILDPETLGADWATETFHRQTRTIGDRWIADGGSLALLVPSAIIPAEWNVLLNPQHPDASQLRIVNREPFRFDPRLRC